MPPAVEVPITSVGVAAYCVPTEEPESDGTLEWDATTCVVVHARAGGATGLGYTYATAAAARLIHDELAGVVQGRDALCPGASWVAMVDAIRNLGRAGLASYAVSAVDVALWDLQARLLDVSLARLVGSVHAAVPVYGSGGFTSYTTEQLRAQLSGWVEAGIPRVKMKVGREPSADPARVAAARTAIGDDAALFVDANGAYTRSQALALAETFARRGVTWLEEPVSSDDLDGLRLLRDRAPAGMDIAAGEYGCTIESFRTLLRAGAVDCLQADVTRCGGISGFLRVAALCDAETIDLSAHCAPALSAHACAGVWHLRHLEYFHDHVRLEGLLFDGTLEPVDGALHPDPARPGLGLELKQVDADRYAV